MSRRSYAVLAASVSLLALSAGAASAQQADGETQLEEITVQGRSSESAGAPGVATNDGYVAKTTRTATKTDLPVNETPATINTVTQRQLEDRRPQTLEEALFYTPGVRVGMYGFNPRFDSFTIRGVDVTYTGVFRDGLRQFNSPSGLFRLEPYGLESISILKGGASAIYGASSSVGIIDLISKRPTDYEFGEVEVQGGSFDRRQASFDFGGPINEEGTVSYRLTGLARDANTNLPGVPDNRVFIAPAVTFKPSEDTKLTLLSEFMDSKTGGSMFYDNFYVPLTDKSGDPIPGYGSGGTLKTLGYDPNYNGFTQTQGRVGYEFEHKFSDAISIHQNVRWSGLSTNERFGDGGLTYRGQVKEEFSSIAADTYLKTELQTGPISHTVLTGVDFGHLKYDSRYGLKLADANGDLIGNPELPDPTKQKLNLWGAYLQDEVKVGSWRLLLGGRHDWYDSSYSEPGSSTFKQNQGNWNGRAGLSYVTEAGLTPYVSYGTSFTANPGTVINGGVAKPTKGEQAEVGVKYAIPGYNASINASTFWLKQVDGIVYAVDSNGVNQQTQLDFRSRGFEIEGVASLDNGVTLQASYSYTDTKILKLSDVTVGNQVNSIPKHAFAIWGGYEFQSGPLKGFGAGAGVRYTGSSFGDDLNRPVLKNKPSAFMDAKVSYDFENLDRKLKGVQLQVNATNLLDKVEQVCSGSYCYLGQGRKVIASLRYRW